MTLFITPIKIHFCLSVTLLGLLVEVLSSKCDGRNKIKSVIVFMPSSSNLPLVATPTPGNVVKSLSFNLIFKKLSIELRQLHPFLFQHLSEAC